MRILEKKFLKKNLKLFNFSRDKSHEFIVHRNSYNKCGFPLLLRYLFLNNFI